MPRLPEIPLNDWLTDQQKRFQEATAGLFPALEFELGARSAESQIPPDFDASGGYDQWEQAEQELIEREARLVQQAEEERRQQEIEAQADQYRRQQQEHEEQQRQQAVQRETSVMEMIKSLGIVTPDMAFAGMGPTGNPTTSSGVFDVGAPTAQDRPLSPVDQFNQFSGGLMEEAFGAPTPPPAPPSPSPEPPRDNESSSGLLDQLGSAVSSAGSALESGRQSVRSAVSTAADTIQENPVYQGMVQGGLMPDRVRQAREVVQAASYLPETTGVGRMLSDFEEERALEDEIRAQYPEQTRSPFGPQSIVTPPEEWIRANPEKAQRLEEIRRNQRDIAIGASGTMGRGGMADDAIDAIKRLHQAGFADEALRAAEGLAQKTSMTLDDILVRVRGTSTATAPEASALRNIPDSELLSLNEFDDAFLAGQIRNVGRADPAFDRRMKTLREQAEDEGMVYVSPRELAERRRLAVQQAEARGTSTATAPEAAAPELPLIQEPTPPSTVLPEGSTLPPPGYRFASARQAELPGMEDVASRPVNRGNVRGYGAIPGDMEDNLVNEIRRVNEGMNAQKTVMTTEERVKGAADLVDADPQVVAPILQRALKLDPKLAGIEQELLRQNVRTYGEWLTQAQDDFNQAQAAVQDLLNRGVKAKDIPNELSSALNGASNEMALVANQLEQAVKGVSLSASAHAQGLAAQRGGWRGARVVHESARLDKLAEVVGTAAKAVKRRLGSPKGDLDQEAQEALREAERLLGQDENVRVITRRRGGAGGPGGTDGAGTARGGRSPAPREETLAEKIGRLEREKRSLEEFTPDAEDELAEIQGELDDLLKTFREQAAERMQDIRAKKGSTGPITQKELEQAINETIGRRALRRVRSEMTKELQEQKPESIRRMEAAVGEGVERFFRDARKIAAAEEKQLQRRIDGILGKEESAYARAERRGLQAGEPSEAAYARNERKGMQGVRAEVQEMANEVRTWAKQLERQPDNDDLWDGFMEGIVRMEGHSDKGKQVAKLLMERLGRNFTRNNAAREARLDKAAARELDAARIRGVQQQIRDVLKNPLAPDRAQRMSQLYDDLAEINNKGAQLASNQRRQAHAENILRSGAAAAVDSVQLHEALAKVNPNDPASFRALLKLINKPNAWQVAREISFINLLSSPVMHLTNVTSTLGNAGLKLAIRNPLEEIFSLGERSGSGQAFVGAVRGAAEGAGAAAKTFMTGINPQRLDDALATGDYSHVGREALPELYRRAGEKVLGGRGGQVGAHIGGAMHAVSTRPLEAMDALMGRMAYQAEAYRLAEQKAQRLLKNGQVTGSTAEVRRDILNNIWDHMDIIEAAGKAENYTLFRGHGSSEAERILRQFFNLKNVGPEDSIGKKLFSVLLDFVVPFTNVPMNFLKQGVDNVASPFWRPLKAAKLYAKGEKGEASEQMARALQGGALLAIPTYLAASGDYLTGVGPTDPADRKIWELTHRPNSVRIPGSNEWISYAGTPAAIPFAIVAGMKEEFERQEQLERKGTPMSPEAKVGWLALRGAAGAGHGLMSQSMIESIGRNLEAISGQAVGENAIARVLSSSALRYTPTGGIAPSGLVGLLAAITDGVERDAGRAANPDEIKEVARRQIISRIPGMRQELPAKTNAWGEPIEASVLRTFHPAGYQGPASGQGDPIAAQLERGSIGLPNAPEKITVGRGRGEITLTLDERRQFQEDWGREFREYLELYGVGQETLTEKKLEQLRLRARNIAERRLKDRLSNDEYWNRRRAVEPLEVTP